MTNYHGNSQLYHLECFARVFDTPELGTCDSRQWEVLQDFQGGMDRSAKLVKTTVKVVLEISGDGMQGMFAVGEPGKMGAVKGH